MTTRAKRPPEPFTGFSSSSSDNDEDAQDSVPRSKLSPRFCYGRYLAPFSKREVGATVRRSSATHPRTERRLRPPCKKPRLESHVDEFPSHGTEGIDEDSDRDKECENRNDDSSSQLSRRPRLPQQQYTNTGKPAHPMLASTPIGSIQATENADSIPGTPSIYRLPPAIRVHLTPSQPDSTVRWRTKSQLLAIAQRHAGMAIQYRVVYSQTTLRDHNAGTATSQIRPGDLVVQSRFMCASGNGGGSTFSFRQWKLPGTLNSVRKARHTTIYDDTRPQLRDASMGTMQETAHPTIMLSSTLNDDDRQMATVFLQQANPGTTPAQFYGMDKEGIRSGQVLFKPTHDIADDQANSIDSPQ